MPRPATGKTGKPVNLYLPTELRDAGQKLALERYHTTLSNLVARLLRHELNRKRGIAHHA